MSKKYYAVKKGKTPGIYFNWDDCRAQVDGFSGAIFKAFNNIEEAEAFFRTKVGEKATTSQKGATSVSSEDELMDVLEKRKLYAVPNYAFVDGSYNSATGRYGYGGFLVIGDKKFVLQGSGLNPEMSSMRNVSGEILGSMAAVTTAIEHNLPEIVIYYDYLGIEKWATGKWKRNKKGTQDYYEFMQKAQKKIKIHFVKVKGHSGVEGNEEADRLAKEAVGIK